MLTLNNVKAGSFMHNFLLSRGAKAPQPVESFAIPSSEFKPSTGPEFEFDDL